METTGVSNELEQALQAFLAQRAVGASDREATTDRLLLALVAENRRLRAGLQELARRHERLAQLGTSALPAVPHCAKGFVCLGIPCGWCFRT